jgi:hypothetical protein
VWFLVALATIWPVLLIAVAFWIWVPGSGRDRGIEVLHGAAVDLVSAGHHAVVVDRRRRKLPRFASSQGLVFFAATL